MSLVRVLKPISRTSLPFKSLSRTGPHDVTIEQAWIGEGSLTLPVCRGEELSELAPIRSSNGIGLLWPTSWMISKTLEKLSK